MAKKRGNNEGSITQRPDGLWEARISLEGSKRKSYYGKTRQEAARKLAEATRDRDKGLLIVTERKTVEQYFTSWLDVMRTKIRPCTWKRYEQYVRKHVIVPLGSLPIERLKAHHLQTLYSAKLAEGLSQTTVHHLHMIIHKALDAAVRLELVQRNVSDLVDPPSMAHPRMAVLTPEQAKAFLEAARGMRFEALFILALLTGMRQGELLALQWSDVDIDGGFLQVRASLYYADREFIFTEPKTNNSRRTVVLPKLAVEALRKHRVRLTEERLALGAAWSTEYDLVFPNTIGSPMDPNSLRRREFQAVLKKAGLPRIRFHDLRHTVATLLFAERVNPKIVSEMLGHSDIAITLGLYGHVTPPMHQQAADTVDKLFQERQDEDQDEGKGTPSGLA